MNKKRKLIIIGISAAAIVSSGIFVTSVSANKQDALIKIVEEASAKVKEEHTEESWSGFEENLEVAKNVLDEGNANVLEINSAYKNLSKSIDEIVEVEDEGKLQEKEKEKETEIEKPEEKEASQGSKEAVIGVEKPSNIQAETESTSATISWEAPKNTENLVEYVIYKDGKTLETIDASNASYKVEDLKANTIYGFKVASKYSNGEISKPISINVRTK